MPSWSTSERPDQPAAPQENDAAAAVEAARKLLRELFEQQPPATADRPAPPEE